MVFRAGRITRAAKPLSVNEDPEYPTFVLEAGWNPEVDRLRPVDETQAGTESDPDPLCDGGGDD